MSQQIAVINDLSGFGKCSLTAAIPVLSSLGLSCHPLATAVLTGQTGYEHYYCQDLTDMIPLYTEKWKQNGAEFSGIYTGFLTGRKQVSHILDFLSVFRRPDTFLLVDPVMGDKGQVYSVYSEKLLAGMKELTSLADMVTPNLMEACLLTGKDYHSVALAKNKEELVRQVESIGQEISRQGKPGQEVLITGVEHTVSGQTMVMTLAVTPQGTFVCETPYIKQSFSGTGDLFASAMCGLHMSGMPTGDALPLVCEFLCKGIRDAVAAETPATDGIPFEKYLTYLTMNL